MKKIFACLCLFVCLPVFAAAAEVGDIDQAGLAKLIKENSGKVVVLNFFATWCPPCRVEMPELVKLRKAFPEKELLLIGLSVDETRAPVPSFVEKAGVNYPVYMAAKDITNLYDINSVPHNAFFNPQGQLVYSEPGLADLEVLTVTINELLGKSSK